MTELGKGTTSYYDNTRLADYTDDAVETGRGSVDMPFLILTLILLAVGVIMVLSASFARAYYDPGNDTGGVATYYFARQLGFGVAGVVAMYFASILPLSFYRRFSRPLMLTTLVLLIAVILIGLVGGGAQRWIGFGTFTVQPSEIAKLAVILTFADMICKRKNKMTDFRKGLVPFLLILAPVTLLVLVEPHLSGAIIIFAVGMIMLYLGGAKIKWLAAILVPALGLCALFVVLFPHASTRIEVWLNPLADPLGDGWQIAQSLYAVGSGGLMGLGLGQSRQKYLYLPEEHNDFIFAVVCEELGFIGACLILSLFALLIIRGFWLAMHAKSRFDFLVCGGLTALLALQVILNVAVVTSMVPCTGISLPFFSYGGTALLMQLGEMGLILSMSRDIPGKKPG